MKPLNPSLYLAIKRTFHHVEIVNPGQRAQFSHRPNWHRKGKLSVQVTGGEYYKTNCPRCDDTKKRLYFNYLWGCEDEKTGRDMLHLVHCFNEDCINTVDEQISLRRLLFPSGGVPVEPIRPHQQKNDDVPSPIYDLGLPHGSIPINDPKCAEIPNHYLIKRNFDPEELWSLWGVRYCSQSRFPPPKFDNRIVIPIHTAKRGLFESDSQQVLAGWQARDIPVWAEDNVKYLTAQGMRKTELLYGLPQAVKTSGPIVICEGVTDVWRLGTNAVAMFGKNLSHGQQQLLSRFFSDRPLVLFLDRDAQTEAKRSQRVLREFRREQGDKSPVVIARLPNGRGDVGDCTRKEAWSAVAKALGKSTSAITQKAIT